MAKEMNVKILLVNKTTEEWASEETVISKGLPCVEFATDGSVKLKIGDGVNQYKSLKYVKDGTINIGDYYNKSQVDSKVSSAISALGNVLTMKGVKATVSELPSSGNKAGDIWFVGTSGSTTDNFAEYVYTAEGKWEFLGRVQTDVDLSGYATIVYVDNKLKPLETASHTHNNKSVLDNTTASYTTAEKEKLAGIASGANKTVVDAALSDTSANPVQAKAIKAALDGKVDKVSGKGLSTNDYTDDEKEKLASLENYDDTTLSAKVDSQGKEISSIKGDLATKYATMESLISVNSSVSSLQSEVEHNYVKNSDELILNCTL